jgi:NADPH:quinone reductase-like Zn-dependent oxidoreductase
VLVTGASGGVGTAAVKLMRQLGCHVTGVTSSTDKVQFLKDIGCHAAVVAAADGQFHKQVEEPVDLVFEAVGAPTFESSLRSLKRGGRLVLAGCIAKTSLFFEPLRCFLTG